MIILEDNSFITSSDFPDTDWTGSAKYVIPDGSEFAKKILDYYPNYKLIYDDNIIVDVIKIEPEMTEEELNIYKNKAINHSKYMLSKWLLENPYLYIDSKYYSVTEEKQSLLNSNLASYERATQAGIKYPLKWNSTGDECTDWSYNDLLTLSLNIAAYVAPKVSMQQSYEIQIKNCTTIEEIDSIVIDYNGNGDGSETNS